MAGESRAVAAGPLALRDGLERDRRQKPRPAPRRAPLAGAPADGPRRGLAVLRHPPRRRLPSPARASGLAAGADLVGARQRMCLGRRLVHAARPVVPRPSRAPELTRMVRRPGVDGSQRLQAVRTPPGSCRLRTSGHRRVRSGARPEVEGAPRRDPRPASRLAPRRPEQDQSATSAATSKACAGSRPPPNGRLR